MWRFATLPVADSPRDIHRFCSKAIYDLEVFNGEVWQVEFIDLEDQHIVRFGNTLVICDYADVLEQGLSCAINYHKS
ncbi:MAG: hypothetical protein U0Z53_00360 [Blastocatellia bacterium]